MTAKSTQSIENFDLAAALKQLDSLERYFSEPTIDLEEGMQKHEKARLIAKEIERYLTSVESRLDVIESDRS